MLLSGYKNTAGYFIRMNDLISTKKSGFSIIVQQLSMNMKHLEQAAIWADGAWGYLDNFQNNSIDDIRAHADRFYVALYNGQMIGMFGLYQHHSLNNSLVIDELNYVYIHPNFRNFGFGRRMIEQAKLISKEKHQADIIIIETTNPKLNKFYEKLGAKFVCDSHTFNTTQKVDTSFLRI